VIAYYSLAAGAIEYQQAPERMSKGLAKHPVPILLMARFAVDKNYHGKGLGSALLKDAIMRYLNVCNEIGARAFVVHAKDEQTKAFYERFGMTTFPNNSSHLYYLKKDIQKTLGL
jgi:GNAT superfamily N-acetyltransferase